MRTKALAVATILVAVIAVPQCALADEGGVSFWLPGQYGSFAAVPVDPGWSLSMTYYHTSVEAEGLEQFDFGATIAAEIDANSDLFFISPTYAFSEPVLGGQLALSVAGIIGRSEATGKVTLTGPGGGTISAERTDEVFGVGDLYPTAELRWNEGTNNFMAYLTGDIPVGEYDENSLANIGINHFAIDAGGGYTYFNPDTGREFSGVAGFTYNFENPATDYQNGIDFHFDGGAAQFLSEQTLVGVVGYYYQQLTGNSGSGAQLGDFESRVAGIGPQLGYFFPLGGSMAYLSLKGYYEFAAEHRLEGWNAWVTVSMPLGGAASPE